MGSTCCIAFWYSADTLKSSARLVLATSGSVGKGRGRANQEGLEVRILMYMRILIHTYVHAYIDIYIGTCTTVQTCYYSRHMLDPIGIWTQCQDQ